MTKYVFICCYSDRHLHEFGVDVGKLLGFLSEVLLFNSFVRAYSTKEKCLEKLLDINTTLLQDLHLLDLLLNTISIIGKIVSFMDLKHLCYKYIYFMF